jgi:hypothetical protein
VKRLERELFRGVEGFKAEEDAAWNLSLGLTVEMEGVADPSLEV